MKNSDRGNQCLIVAGLAVFALACSATTDPFGTGPGRVACGDTPAVVAQTDALGRYVTNLEASANAVNAGKGRVSCRFTEPADGVVRVQRDTVLGFAQGPVLVALQTVNLQEH
jgi:hypothetical protein